MVDPSSNINLSYERHYAERASEKVYPTEFVVRTFMAKYPGLNFTKPIPGSKILDVGFGHGRNAALLCEAGLEVSGIEITQGIVDQTSARMARLGHQADLRLGRNSSIPFGPDEFDYILACHCCYYCDEGQSLLDNLKEYSRGLKKNGFFVASVANRASYIFNGATELPDGSLVVNNDPYNNRNGYRLHGFSTSSDIVKYFSPLFKNFTFGSADNDYFGVIERVFWVVAQKK